MSSTDFRTIKLVDVNCTVTVINQRRLPPILLTAPRITAPAHRRGGEPPWRMDTEVSKSKVIFVIRELGLATINLLTKFEVSFSYLSSGGRYRQSLSPTTTKI